MIARGWAAAAALTAVLVLLLPGAAIAAPGQVLIDELGGVTAVEGGPNGSYTVSLDSQPVADVHVDLEPDTQLDTTPSTLTFDAGSWNVPQVVNVSAVDDAISEGMHLGQVAHTVTSADPNFDGAVVGTVNVSVIDNDATGVFLTESGGSTSTVEGMAGDSFWIELTTEPTSPVEIHFAPDTQVSVSDPMLTFDSTNWYLAQSVTVMGVEDGIPEGLHTGLISFSVTSGDPNYDGYPIPDLVVDVVDAGGGVLVSQTGGTTEVAEWGGTDSYDVVLVAPPVADVTVDLVFDDGQLVPTPTTLTFTPGDWNLPQTIEVAAVDDPIAESSPHSSAIQHVVTSADPSYDGIVVNDVVVSITDEDAAGVYVVETDGATSVSEGGPGADTYDIVLDTQPTGNVTITIESSEVVANPSTVTFTPADWRTPQFIWVAAVDDDRAESTPHTGLITHTVTSTDPMYDAMPVDDLAVSIDDNDVAGVAVTETGDTTVVGEDGTTDDVLVVLTSQPMGTVVLHADPDQQLTAAPGSLYFDAANWDVPQLLTVGAVLDADQNEGEHEGVLSFAATSPDDPMYSGIAVPAVTATISDAPITPATVSVVPTHGTVRVSEGGPGDGYALTLDAAPTAPVTIEPLPDTQLSTSPAELTFTPADWFVPQMVSVDAVDDDTAEPTPHPGVIGHQVTSLDPRFDGIDVPDLLVDISDNDTAPPPPPADTTPPQAGAITAPSALRQVARGSRQVVRWRLGSDGGSGAASADVRVREAQAARAGWGRWRIWLHGTTARSRAMTLRPGSTYCFQVRTRDHAGNVSGWSAQRCIVRIIPVTSATRSRGWKFTRRAGYQERVALTTSRRRASLRFPAVRGSRLALLVSTCPRCDLIELRVSGYPAWEHSTHAARRRHRQQVVVHSGSAARRRTVTVRNPRAAQVHIEGLLVLP